MMWIRKALPVVAVLILAAVTPCLAAETAPGEHEAISPFAGNLGNAIWTLLIFVLVVVVLGKFAWRPILSGLQKREEYIRESLMAAKRDRTAAEARLKEYGEKLDHAREDASALVEEGRRKAEAVKRRMEEDARKSADETIDRAKREIDIARDAALQTLYERSAAMAMNMAGNILKREVSAEDHRRLVEDALSELRKRNGDRNGS